jgi:hypothetical protein
VFKNIQRRDKVESMLRQHPEARGSVWESAIKACGTNTSGGTYHCPINTAITTASVWNSGTALGGGTITLVTTSPYP